MRTLRLLCGGAGRWVTTRVGDGWGEIVRRFGRLVRGDSDVCSSAFLSKCGRTSDSSLVTLQLSANTTRQILVQTKKRLRLVLYLLDSLSAGIFARVDRA